MEIQRSELETDKRQISGTNSQNFNTSNLSDLGEDDVIISKI